MSFSQKLTTWMHQSSLSDSALGRMLTPQVTRQSVMDWRKGRYLPSDVYSGQLIRLSIDFISADDFII